LAAEELIVRVRLRDGKFLSVLVNGHFGSGSGAPLTVERPRRKAVRRGAERVDKLVASFAACVAEFEASAAFPGLSLYFHLWPSNSAASTRMPSRCFDAIVSTLRQQTPTLQDLRPLQITALNTDEARCLVGSTPLLFELNLPVG
jgi:hypothetical protein